MASLELKVDASDPRAFLELLEAQRDRLSELQRAALLNGFDADPVSMIEVELEDGRLVATMTPRFLRLLEECGVELPGWMS